MVQPRTEIGADQHVEARGVRGSRLARLEEALGSYLAAALEQTRLPRLWIPAVHLR